jgi:mycothiol synthase
MRRGPGSAIPPSTSTRERDVVIAEWEGHAVGVGGLEWVDTRDGHVARVPPLGRGRAGAYRAAASVARSSPTTSVEHRRSPPPGTGPTDRRARLRRRGASPRRCSSGSGYEVVRWFFDMVRPSLDEIEEVALPAGLELRPVRPDQLATIWRANREAFRDHWGGADESERRCAACSTTPIPIRPCGSSPGMATRWPAASSTRSTPRRTRSWDARGWLESVFTRRRWRPRGLARALIGRSLLLLRERGMTSAALGVDADNSMGALGLYEAAGVRGARSVPGAGGSRWRARRHDRDDRDGRCTNRPGLRFRRYRGEADLPAMLARTRAAHEANGIEEVTTVEQFGLNYADARQLRPARDITWPRSTGSSSPMRASSGRTSSRAAGPTRTSASSIPTGAAWHRRGDAAAQRARMREIAAGHAGVVPEVVQPPRERPRRRQPALLEREGYSAGALVPRHGGCRRSTGRRVRRSRRHRAPTGHARAVPRHLGGGGGGVPRPLGRGRSGPRRTGVGSRPIPTTPTRASGVSGGMATRSPA